jgi:ABC-type sugar transport system permease subunit
MDRWADVRRNWHSYVFIAPGFVLFAVFGLFPYFYAFFLSAHEWNGIGPMRHVGLDNYGQLVRDGLWWVSVFNSGWLLAATSLNLIIALFLAVLLSRVSLRLRMALQTVFFLPYVASSVAMAIVFITLFGYHYGAFNSALGFFGFEPINWLKDPRWIKPAIAIVVIWRSFGWNTLIYSAGLRTIPIDLYDAARVDGANQRELFFDITLPLLRPVITFTVILTIIGSFQLFEEPLLIAGGGAYPVGAGGGTAHAGLTMLVNLFSTAFGYLQLGYAAAMSVVLFLIMVTFSLAFYRLQRVNPAD